MEEEGLILSPEGPQCCEVSAGRGEGGGHRLEGLVGGRPRESDAVETETGGRQWPPDCRGGEA